MRKWVDLIGKEEKNYHRLLSEYHRDTNEYNGKTLSTLLPIGWGLSLIALAAVPFSSTKSGAVPAYLLTFFSYFVLFMLYKIPAIKKYTLVGLYISFSVMFLFTTYLSVIHSPNMRATILLGGFGIMPISFIDSPRRTRLFLFFWLAVHTVLAYFFKPLIALDDTINCLCATVLGLYLGKTINLVRLDSFEVKRLLIYEKETDVLTGLRNRRSLFEMLSSLEISDAKKPSGILMLDIDHFKQLNDDHGHSVGDQYLAHLGELLRTFTDHDRLRFYRYGGEEFVGLVYGYPEHELLSIAENLRIAIESADMDGHRITVSIGLAICGDEQEQNYENAIVRADKAAYTAKRLGRNRVAME